MLTLYGTKGSGSASTEAALEIAGLAYRKVEAASWKPSPGLDELKRVNPIAQIPTLRARRRQRAHRERGDPDPPRPRPSARAACSPASRRGARSRSAAWSTSPPTATPASASSTIPIAGIPIPTTRSSRRCRRAAGPGCTSCGRSSPTSSRPRPGSRASASARSTSSPRRCRSGAARARRWPSRGPQFAALLARIDADPRIAAVWARHWPQAPSDASGSARRAGRAAARRGSAARRRS